MAYVMNCLPWSVTTQAMGKWFTFAPEQPKMIHDEHIAHFLVTKRGDQGIVGVPEEVVERKAESPEEYKSKIEELRKEGILKKTEALKAVIHNLEIGLRRDLEMKNIKADPLTYASKGEVEAYRQLAQLEAEPRNKLVTPADEIRAIKEKLNGSTNLNNSGAAPAGNPGNPPAAKG